MTTAVRGSIKGPEGWTPEFNLPGPFVFATKRDHNAGCDL